MKGRGKELERETNELREATRQRERVNECGSERAGEENEGEGTWREWETRLSEKEGEGNSIVTK